MAKPSKRFWVSFLGSDPYFRARIILPHSSSTGALVTAPPGASSKAPGVLGVQAVSALPPPSREAGAQAGSQQAAAAAAALARTSAPRAAFGLGIVAGVLTALHRPGGRAGGPGGHGI